MNGRFAGCCLTLAVLAAVTPAVSAQYLVPDNTSGAVHVILTPLGPQAGPASAPIAADPNLPAIFPGNLKVDLGFAYLRPDFPGGAIRISAPPGVNANVAALAGSGDISYDFAFVPKFSARYDFTDLGFGMGASGELASLSGHVNRTIDSAVGSANLTGSGTVNFAHANLLEGLVPMSLSGMPCFKDTWLEDTRFLGTLGARYSHLSQDYTASLASGASSTTLTAHQDWDGFGLTTSFSFWQPMTHDFYLYGVSRGSFLLGTNNRTSNLVVVASGDAAGSASTKLTDNRTNFIPIGEFEVGVAWGKALASPGRASMAAAPTGPLLWLKVGLVADIWGSLGVLSAPDDVRGFSNGRLLLWGFSVLAGVQY